jgi:hypothetical protein
MPTIDLKHRDASSVLHSLWEIDSRSNTIVVAVRLSERAPTICCDLNACSSRKPRTGALALSRVDETTWRLMPARYRFGGGYWATYASAYDHEALLPLWPMLLTHASVEANALLEAM